MTANRILHFSPSLSFDKKFLFHPVYNDAIGGTYYFSIAQSGYVFDRSSLRRIASEYLRATRLLIRGIGTTNRETIAYCHTTKISLPALILCRLFGVGQVIYFNHGVPYVGHKGLMGWTLRFIDRANIFVAHRFLTVSPGMVELLKPSSTPDPWEHSTRPGSSSGLQKDYFIRPLSYSSKPNDSGDKGLKYLYAGRLQERKGLFVLLEAWRKHVQQFPNDELWICGFSEEELAKHGDWVELPQLVFKGYVTDMDAIYRQIDVVVSASFHEGFGYTLLEGAARGCCIISTDIAGPDIMFTPWMRDQLFLVRDSEALSKTMAKFSGSPKQLAIAKLLSYRSALRFEMSKITLPPPPPR